MADLALVTMNSEVQDTVSGDLRILEGLRSWQCPWWNNETGPLRTDFWTPKGEGGEWQQPVCIYAMKIMPDQLDWYAKMTRFVDEAKAVDVILPCLL